jgi:hypothetical protein
MEERGKQRMKDILSHPEPLCLFPSFPEFSQYKEAKVYGMDQLLLPSHCSWLRQSLQCNTNWE